MGRKKQVEAFKLEEEALQRNFNEIESLQNELKEALFQYTKGSKIPPSVLKDFNINRIKTKDDFLRLIDITSRSFRGSIDKQTRGVQTQEITKRLSTLLNKNPENLQRTLLK